MNQDDFLQRRVFIVRLWRESQDEGAWRGEIQPIGDNPKTVYVRSLGELLDYFLHDLTSISHGGLR